jgi:amino acid adenylation domain-containing protein
MEDSIAVKQRNVVEGFDEWVVKAPDDVAIVVGDQSLTYRRLDQRANRAAWALRARGAGRSTVVGICLPRGIDLAVAVLAVLKSGAAFLPLEPDHPVGRRRSVLLDAGATLAVTGPASGADDLGVPTVHVTEDSVAGFPAERPACVAGADDLLYVIYTSGSTGRPKGIAMQHGPQVTLLDWSREQYARRPTALHYFPITADVAMMELLSAWWTGGRVVLATDAQRHDIAAVAELIRRHRITKVHLPVVAMKQLARHAVDHPTDVASLRELISTGDRLAITPEIRQMCARLPGVRLDDQYGPTETDVVTAARFVAPTEDWRDSPPIGRPTPGARVYVLDAHLRPTAENVTGEIVVGGAPVAWGYLGRGGSTATAFVPDPFAAEPGARMYRTGDLGRWRAGGELEFLGRADFQVKIRGYRIEPGEIESVLTRRDDVDSAVVVAVAGPGTGSEPMLVAYVVPAAEPPSADRLRDDLAARLPAYMVPHTFVFLDRLPLTGNGKVDRRRLPRPTVAEPRFVAPRDELESTIAAIWAEALDLETVGVRHNFFRLGGHSLLVTRVMFHLRQKLGVDLPLISLFQLPTVEALAGAARAHLTGRG